MTTLLDSPAKLTAVALLVVGVALLVWLTFPSKDRADDGDRPDPDEEAASGEAGSSADDVEATAASFRALTRNDDDAPDGSDAGFASAAVNTQDDEPEVQAAADEEPEGHVAEDGESRSRSAPMRYRTPARTTRSGQ